MGLSVNVITHFVCCRLKALREKMKITKVGKHVYVYMYSFVWKSKQELD